MLGVNLIASSMLLALPGDEQSQIPAKKGMLLAGMGDRCVAERER